MTVNKNMSLLALIAAVFWTTGCGDRGAAGPTTQPAGHAEHAGHDEHAGHGHAAHEQGGHAGHDEHANHHDEHADEVTLTAEAVASAGIRVAPAGMHLLGQTLLAPARVGFNREGIAHVGSPVAGRAAQVQARVGAQVKKGDVLLVVESPELGEAQSDYLQKRGAVTSAGPAVELAKSAYERAKTLHAESEGIALAEVQKREGEHKASLAAAAAARAALTAAENRLHLLGISQERINLLAQTGEIDIRHPVLAPIDGQVLEREVTLGELVRPERDALVVLADLSTLWVLADVPEARARQVAVGAEATVRVGAGGDEALEGKVTYIAPQLDAATRTATVRIEVNDARSVLRPGMFAQARIRVAGDQAARPVLAVPQEAVQTVEGGPAVFVPVEGEPNTFARRAVKTGATVGGMTELLEGLKEGEPVVVAGSFILKADLGKSGAAHEH